LSTISRKKQISQPIDRSLPHGIPPVLAPAEMSRPIGMKISSSRVRFRAAVDHADAGHALAGRGAAPRQLEVDEVENAQEEQHQIEDAEENDGAQLAGDRYEHEREQEHESGREADQQIDQQRDRPLGEFGQFDGERHAFRRDDVAALAPVGAQQRSGGGLGRAHRVSGSGRTSCR
jgi:hypothetical protein